MTLAEIRDWALSHGFEETRDDVLTAEVDCGGVEIEFLARNVRVSLVSGTGRHRLLTSSGKQAHVNEHGVLEGLGLSVTFIRGLYPSRPGRAAPPWMGQGYLDAMGWGGEPALRPPHPR